MKAAEANILEVIPTSMSSTDILSFINSENVNVGYLKAVKGITEFSDAVISGFLNMNVKTYRSYKNKNSNTLIKEVDLKEHTVVLLTLFKHGIAVFGSVEIFDNWLLTDHFYLDGKKPVDYLKTISGIQFLNERLKGMEFGDNA
jgi:uncharacterized protein (DUF2384 family)